MKDFLIEEHLLPPVGCRWRYQDWKAKIGRRTAETRVMELHMATHKFDQKEWDTLGRESMEVLFPERVLILQESIGFFDQLIANPHYQNLWIALEIKPSDKVGWIGLVASQFFSRPTPKLLSAVKSLRSRVDWSVLAAACVVQFRTFYDIGSPNLRLLDAFLEELDSLVHSLPVPPVMFYVTTDSLDATERVCVRLESYGKVVPSPVPIVHTGGMHVGWELFLEKALGKIFRKEFYFFDYWGWLPSRLRPRPHTRVLAEWYLMGEFGLAVSTFTSFSVYALARTANQGTLFKFNPETGALQRLHGDDYGF